MTEEQDTSQPHDTPDQDAEAQDIGPQAIPPPGGPDMDLGGYISTAWNLVTGDFVLFVIGYLVVAVILAISCITIVGPSSLGGL